MRSVLTRLTILLVAVVLLGIWATALGRGLARGVASGVLTPFASLWSGLTERIGTNASALTGLGDASERLREARLEAARLRLAAAEAEDLRRQNQDLRAYYGLPARQGWRVVLAEVTLRDPATWNRGFRINRGSHDGVVPGCAVMADAAVIGRISEVQAGSATVLTVGARGCRLSVVLETSKSTGILEGTGVGRWLQTPRCQVDYLPRDTAVEAGELVWTSGLGGGVPGGLVVGRVATRPGAERVLEWVDGAHGRLAVAPTAPFGRLLFVAVYCPDPSMGPR